MGAEKRASRRRAERERPPKRGVEPPASDETGRKPSRRSLLYLIGIAATCLLLYAPAAGHDFINWDDGLYVVDNPHIELTWANVVRMATSEMADNYHPLTMLSLSVNHWFSGLDPAPYHVTNIVLHVLNTILVFLFIRELTGGDDVAASIVALLFGIHPMHVESVAWVSERKDVLYTLFFVAGLIAYVRYVRTSRFGWFLAAGSLGVLSALSKPAAVVFPVVLLLLDGYLGRSSIRRLVVEKLPLFAISFVFGMVTVAIQSQSLDVQRPDDVDRAVFVSYGLAAYVVKAVVPTNLSVFYPYPPEGSPLPLLYLLSPLAVLGLVVATWRSRRRTKVGVFGALFFLTTIALVMQVVGVGWTIMADRYTYVPYIGLFFVLAVAFTKAIRSGPLSSPTLRGVSVCLLVLYLGALARATHERLAAWSDSLSLWDDAVQEFPEAWYPYHMRGFAHHDLGNLAEALADYDRTLELRPTYGHTYARRGDLLLELGEYRRAIADYDRLLQIDPDEDSALLNRGIARLRLGETDQALVDLDAAIEADPTNPTGYYNRGLVHHGLLRSADAIEDYTRAIELKPDYTEAYVNRGNLYRDADEPDLALADFTNALELRPGFRTALNNRGLAYLKLGRYEEALADFDECVESDPSYLSPYFNRAAVYLDDGRQEFEKALREYDRILAIDPANSRAQSLREECLRKLGRN